MRKIVLCFLLFQFSAATFAQSDVSDSLASLFHQQLVVFPQEKLYLHTDKPYYISGERIWFRAYLCDAISHVPTSVSRYVYAELINPLDSVVVRVKIRNEEDAYHGYLFIPDDAPEGDYIIRAYTSFMRSLDEDYFFSKTVRVSDPQSRYLRIEPQFVFESERRVRATFRFSSAGSGDAGAPVVPQSVKITLSEGRQVNARINDDGESTANFNMPANASRKAVLVEIVALNALYRLFAPMPAADDDFDVAFYPEGGSVMQGVISKVAFKAMRSNGASIDVNGIVYDNSGNEITDFSADHLGMGSFSFIAEKGKTYYAICTSEQGRAMRFDLPAAAERGYALSVNQLRGRLLVSVLKPADCAQNDEIYLVAHTRGIVHFSERWDHSGDIVVMPQELFPSGVLHLILFDAAHRPISERLVFINNNDQASVVSESNKPHYATRDLIKKSVKVSDSEGRPLTGSLSVAVTSDNAVKTDSTSGMLTNLLLTSDLRGHIENPAFYFRNTTASKWALDLLMRTQGWRRYDIAELAQGRFSRPASPLELGPEMSGTVQSVLLGRAVEDVDVTVMSMRGNFFDSTVTDKDGRFFFHDGELPDSTIFLVSSVPKRGMTRMDLLIDSETFPEITLSAPPFAGFDREQMSKYAQLAERQYASEFGARIYHLSEVTVTAERRPPRRSKLYSMPNNSITEEELEKFPATDIRSLLMRVPGVMISGQSISIRGAGEPLLVVDEVPSDIEYLDMINIHDIAQIDVLKDAGNTAIFGSRGGNGVIVIFTKEGRTSAPAQRPFHIKTVMPLGYQAPVEFYAPKYDTPQRMRSPNPDLRTTIHWQPVVHIDSEGKAEFEFYSADTTGTYTVIVEGLSDDGRIIVKEEKITIRNDFFEEL